MPGGKCVCFGVILKVKSEKEPIRKEVDSEDTCYFWPSLCFEYCWCHQQYVITHLVNVSVITFQKIKEKHLTLGKGKILKQQKNVVVEWWCHQNNARQNNADVIIFITWLMLKVFVKLKRYVVPIFNWLGSSKLLW